MNLDQNYLFPQKKELMIFPVYSYLFTNGQAYRIFKRNKLINVAYSSHKKMQPFLVAFNTLKINKISYYAKKNTESSPIYKHGAAKAVLLF